MTAPEIIAAIRHQLSPGISTWSQCANHSFCGERAKGGRECIKCLRCQLIEECGCVDKVDSFIAAQKLTFRLQDQIISLAGGEVVAS